MLYKLSRFSRLHHFLRSVGNGVLFKVPEGVKYRVGSWLRSRRLPYRLLRPGDTVVQVGAPWDLLRAGRSRAIHFAQLVGSSGRVVVVEPDPDNVRVLREFVRRRGIENVTVVPKGAWSEKAVLRFLQDKAHPASNLVESVFDAKRTDRDKYDVTEVAVNSIDAILDKLGVERVRLVSLTTNGSESEILRGMEETSKRADYIATVGDPQNYAEIFEYEFEFFKEDDRGYVFENRRCRERKT